MIDLRKGDCLEVMKDIPDNSIDLIVTDPPYLQENHGGGKSDFAQRKLVKMPKETIGFISNSFDMESVFNEFDRICKNLNRNFIGIELSQEYYDIAKERIEKEV